MTELGDAIVKYSIGDLILDTGRQLVTRAGEPIPLPKLSYDLLLALTRAAPNVVPLDALMRLVWSGIVVSPETVSQRVKLLRDALGDDPRVPRYIGGLRGRGYQIIAEVREDVLQPVLANAAADYYLNHIKVDPDFVRLANNPRFRAMIAAAEARLGSRATGGATADE